jgi:hypothetical protein
MKREAAKTELPASQNGSWAVAQSLWWLRLTPPHVLENDRVRDVCRVSPTPFLVPTFRWPCMWLIATWRDLVCRDHLGHVIMGTRRGRSAQTQPANWAGFPATHFVENARKRGV